MISWHISPRSCPGRKKKKSYPSSITDSTNMHPLILGYADNTLLDDHFEKYFLELQTFLSGKIDDMFIAREFLLIPDISATIEYMQRSPSNIEKGLVFLSAEWLKFSQGRKSEMFSFQGDIIP
jgi:hypothetical protein